MKTDFTEMRASYNALSGIFNSGAYSSIELDRILKTVPRMSASRVTAMVYGVLEKSITLDYYINKLTNKKPKPNIALLLKLALYELLYGNDADYAVVSKYVDFAKERFSGADKFVNAILRNAKKVELEAGDSPHALSVKFSVPEWCVSRLLRDYGNDAIDILSYQQINMTHIRRNSLKVSKEDFEAKLSKIGEFSPTSLGYYVRRNTLIGLNSDEFTPQSLSSMMAVNNYISGISTDKEIRVLDLCAAPGGKSLYLQELASADILACDIHPHRVELIKSYAHRLGRKLPSAINDATAHKPEWAGQFDLVICDVPCSGSGLLKSSADILLFKSDKDILSLTKLQTAILNAASKYVKQGGVLAYSTCSLFNAENEEIADKFTAHHSDFAPIDSQGKFGNSNNAYTKFLPHIDGSDGFFIARWQKH